MSTVWLNPAIALGVFLMLAWGLYRLGGSLAAEGEPHPDKHRVYTGGEVNLPQARKVSYRAFFRLALMFSVLHVSVLVLSTLPPGAAPYLAYFCLVGTGVSVLVLTEGGL